MTDGLRLSSAVSVWLVSAFTGLSAVVMYSPWLLLLVICAGIVFAQYEYDYLYEGDICKLERGALWTCKSMRNCTKAREDLRKGKRPQHCNFMGSEPVVCCEPQAQPPPAGAKSKEMCKKYAEFVFHTVQDPVYNDELKINDCGAVEPLITNGTDAEPQEYPHMALIGYGNTTVEWLCAGTLISERFVLSAAHCTDAGIKGLASWVRLGEYDVKNTHDNSLENAKSREYEIIERINHPRYRKPRVYNDIALYKLKTDVEFNPFVRPICLQTEHQFAKTYAIATGWGRTEWGGIGSDVLQKVNLTIIARKQCSDAFPATSFDRLRNGIDDASMLCAGDIAAGKDTCQGDSGGPLQIRLFEPYCMYSQVGITSFGARCGGNKPGVYTRVSHFVPWIESIVWP